LVFEFCCETEIALACEQGANVSEHLLDSARPSGPPPTDCCTPAVVPVAANEPPDTSRLLAGVLSEAHSDERNALAALAVSYLCGI
jgi:hypothetical protein